MAYKPMGISDARDLARSNSIKGDAWYVYPIYGKLDEPVKYIPAKTQPDGAGVSVLMFVGGKSV